MALVLGFYLVLGSETEQGIMCCRWNAIFMATAGGNAIMYISWISQSTCWIIWQMFKHIVPRLCTLCHLVTRIYVVKLYCICPLPSLSNLSITCPWLSTGHLLLELYQCQVQLGPAHEPWYPLVDRRYRQSIRPRFLTSLFNRGPLCEVCSIKFLCKLNVNRRWKWHISQKWAADVEDTVKDCFLSC